jgi:hypothetical protein
MSHDETLISSPPTARRIELAFRLPPVSANAPALDAATRPTVATHPRGVDLAFRPRPDPAIRSPEAEAPTDDHTDVKSPTETVNPFLRRLGSPELQLVLPQIRQYHDFVMSGPPVCIRRDTLRPKMRDRGDGSARAAVNVPPKRTPELRRGRFMEEMIGSGSRRRNVLRPQLGGVGKREAKESKPGRNRKVGKGGKSRWGGGEWRELMLEAEWEKSS